MERREEGEEGWKEKKRKRNGEKVYEEKEVAELEVQYLG